MYSGNYIHYLHLLDNPFIGNNIFLLDIILDTKIYFFSYCDNISYTLNFEDEYFLYNNSLLFYNNNNIISINSTDVETIFGYCYYPSYLHECLILNKFYNSSFVIPLFRINIYKYLYYLKSDFNLYPPFIESNISLNFNLINNVSLDNLPIFFYFSYLIIFLFFFLINFFIFVINCLCIICVTTYDFFFVSNFIFSHYTYILYYDLISIFTTYFYEFLNLRTLKFTSSFFWYVIIIIIVNFLILFFFKIFIEWNLKQLLLLYYYIKLLPVRFSHYRVLLNLAYFYKLAFWPKGGRIVHETSVLIKEYWTTFILLKNIPEEWRDVIFVFNLVYYLRNFWNKLISIITSILLYISSLFTFKIIGLNHFGFIIWLLKIFVTLPYILYFTDKNYLRSIYLDRESDVKIDQGHVLYIIPVNNWWLPWFNSFIRPVLKLIPFFFRYVFLKSRRLLFFFIIFFINYFQWKLLRIIAQSNIIYIFIYYIVNIYLIGKKILTPIISYLIIFLHTKFRIYFMYYLHFNIHLAFYKFICLMTFSIETYYYRRTYFEYFPLFPSTFIYKIINFLSFNRFLKVIIYFNPFYIISYMVYYIIYYLFFFSLSIYHYLFSLNYFQFYWILNILLYFGKLFLKIVSSFYIFLFFFSFFIIWFFFFKYYFIIFIIFLFLINFFFRIYYISWEKFLYNLGFYYCKFLDFILPYLSIILKFLFICFKYIIIYPFFIFIILLIIKNNYILVYCLNYIHSSFFIYFYFILDNIFYVLGYFRDLIYYCLYAPDYIHIKKFLNHDYDFSSLEFSERRRYYRYRYKWFKVLGFNRRHIVRFHYSPRRLILYQRDIFWAPIKVPPMDTRMLYYWLKFTVYNKWLYQNFSQIPLKLWFNFWDLYQAFWHDLPSFFIHYIYKTLLHFITHYHSLRGGQLIYFYPFRHFFYFLAVLTSFYMYIFFFINFIFKYFIPIFIFKYILPYIIILYEYFFLVFIHSNPFYNLIMSFLYFIYSFIFKIYKLYNFFYFYFIIIYDYFYIIFLNSLKDVFYYYPKLWFFFVNFCKFYLLFYSEFLFYNLNFFYKLFFNNIPYHFNIIYFYIKIVNYLWNWYDYFLSLFNFSFKYKYFLKEKKKADACYSILNKQHLAPFASNMFALNKYSTLSDWYWISITDNNRKFLLFDAKSITRLNLFNFHSKLNHPKASKHFNFGLFFIWHNSNRTFLIFTYILIFLFYWKIFKYFDYINDNSYLYVNMPTIFDNAQNYSKIYDIPTTNPDFFEYYLKLVVNKVDKFEKISSSYSVYGAQEKANVKLKEFILDNVHARDGFKLAELYREGRFEKISYKHRDFVNGIYDIDSGKIMSIFATIRTSKLSLIFDLLLSYKRFLSKIYIKLKLNKKYSNKSKIKRKFRKMTRVVEAFKSFQFSISDIFFKNDQRWWLFSFFFPQYRKFQLYYNFFYNDNIFLPYMSVNYACFDEHVGFTPFLIDEKGLSSLQYITFFFYNYYKCFDDFFFSGNGNRYLFYKDPFMPAFGLSEIGIPSYLISNGDFNSHDRFLVYLIGYLFVLYLGMWFIFLSHFSVLESFDYLFDFDYIFYFAYFFSHFDNPLSTFITEVAFRDFRFPHSYRYPYWGIQKLSPLIDTEYNFKCFLKAFPILNVTYKDIFINTFFFKIETGYAFSRFEKFVDIKNCCIGFFYTIYTWIYLKFFVVIYLNFEFQISFFILWIKIIKILLFLLFYFIIFPKSFKLLLFPFNKYSINQSHFFYTKKFFNKEFLKNFGPFF